MSVDCLVLLVHDYADLGYLPCQAFVQLACSETARHFTSVMHLDECVVAMLMICALLMSALKENFNASDQPRV